MKQGNGGDKKKYNKPGPKLKEINWRQFNKLCEYQCTLEEIAGVLGVSGDTIERACKREFEKGFAELFSEKGSKGRTTLRRSQYRLAQLGNATMLIWLGKQWLGQKEMIETKSQFSIEQLNNLRIAWEDESDGTNHTQNAPADSAPKAH